MKLTLFLFVFLVLSSCNQNKPLKEDLGNSVTADTYEKAVVEAWGSDDILTIKKNDYAYVEKSISLNYGPMRKSIGKAMTVTEITEEESVVKHHIVIQSEEIQDGTQSKLSTRERVLSVKRAASQTQTMMEANAKNSTNNQLKDQSSSDLGIGQLNVEDEIQATPFEGFLDALNLCRYKTVECFKLKVENFEEDVPSEVKEQNCRFFEGCKWRGKKVSFVIRVSYKEEGSDEVKTQNNIISFKIVNNMPYLFKMVEYCFEGLSEYQGQKFPVKICTQVKDAIKGE